MVTVTKSIPMLKGKEKTSIYKDFVIIFAFFLFALMPAYSQPEKGTWGIRPEIGANSSRFVDVDPQIQLKHSGLGGVTGVEVEYQATNRIGLSAGALFSFQHITTAEDDGRRAFGEQSSQSAVKKMYDNLLMGYVNVPLMANVYLWKGLSVKAGVQAGYAVFAKVHQKEWQHVDIIITDFEEGYLNVADRIHRFDVSIPVGLSYEYKNFVIDARYHIGLTPVIKSANYRAVAFDCEYDDNAKNRVLQVTLGYKFHL